MSPLTELPSKPLVERRRQEINELGDRIAELSAHIQAATYRLLVMIREFDEREGWYEQGAKSCAHWLNWRTGLHLGAAREKVRVARALEDLPLISDAMRKGEVSYSKVRAMTRVATPENEDILLDFARAGTAAHVETVVRGWRRVDRANESLEAERRYEGRSVRIHTDEDGMVVVRARLEPEAGAVLQRALDAAAEELYEATKKKPRDASRDQAPPGQRRADALALVAESALANGLDRGTRGDRYQVVVHVDAAPLEDPEQDGESVVDGTHVSAETSRRLACDASRVVMTHAPDGTLLDVGRKTRTVPAPIRRALEHRDRSSCRYPGCTNRICDAHHVHHWANGGSTDLDNLLLLCRFHHRKVHEGGFRVELRPDGEARFYSPHGWHVPTVPPPPQVPRDPVETLYDTHRDEGLEIHEETGLPLWNGDPFRANAVTSALMTAAADRCSGLGG